MDPTKPEKRRATNLTDGTIETLNGEVLHLNPKKGHFCKTGHFVWLKAGARHNSYSPTGAPLADFFR
jgi:hypothetical protein